MSRKLVAVSVLAPAKINLTLHVTGQRADGYHELDSLVAFADVADDLRIQIGNTLSLKVEGPEAHHVPVDMQNLILKVATLFNDLPGASFQLTKRLPVASGIGGGSADGAAAFRGLMVFSSGGEVDFKGYDILSTPMGSKLGALGADIPMCLRSSTARATGIGTDLQPEALPNVAAVLINPRVGVSTPDVFKMLKYKKNSAMPEPPAFRGLSEFVDWLQDQRNDLQKPAMKLCPEIGNVLHAFWDVGGCLLARMSGSGATCFGLFETVEAARKAAAQISANHPDWWVVDTVLGDQITLASPQVQWKDA